MSILGKHRKQSGETESYTINYSEDLTDGDGVISVDVTLTPPGAVLVATHNDLTSLRVWISGGTPGSKYKLEATALTGDGRVLQDEFFVTIKDF